MSLVNSDFNAKGLFTLVVHINLRIFVHVARVLMAKTSVGRRVAIKYEPKRQSFHLLCCHLLFTAILDKLKAGGNRNPFRPHVAIEEDTKELHALMCRCWAEKPDDRPGSKTVLTNLRKLSK